MGLHTYSQDTVCSAAAFCWFCSTPHKEPCLTVWAQSFLQGRQLETTCLCPCTEQTGHGNQRDILKTYPELTSLQRLCGLRRYLQQCYHSTLQTPGIQRPGPMGMKCKGSQTFKTMDSSPIPCSHTALSLLPWRCPGKPNLYQSTAMAQRLSSVQTRAWVWSSQHAGWGYRMHGWPGPAGTGLRGQSRDSPQRQSSAPAA